MECKLPGNFTALSYAKRQALALTNFLERTSVRGINRRLLPRNAKVPKYGSIMMHDASNTLLELRAVSFSSS